MISYKQKKPSVEKNQRYGYFLHKVTLLTPKNEN